MSASYDAFIGAQGLRLDRLSEHHYLEFFDCGRDEAMNAWLRDKAREWQAEELCVVWVLTQADNPETPMGFFTLSSHQILPVNIDRRIKAVDSGNRSWVNALQQPFPAQLLGKFAIGVEFQGKGLGEILMLGVYAKHVAAADAAGAKFLVIDVQEDRLVEYYRDRYDFYRSTKSGAMAQMYRPTRIIRDELTQVLLPPVVAP